METIKIPVSPACLRSVPLHLPTTGASPLQTDNSYTRLRLIEGFASGLKEAIILVEPKTWEDAPPRIVAINPAFEDVFGYSREEALGRSLRLLRGAKTDPTVQDEIIRAAKDRLPLSRSIFHYDKEGHEHNVDVNVFPVLDDRQRCTAVAISQFPIEPLLEQEETARLSGERFSQAFEFGPIGMALIAPDGHWLTVNRKLCELIGYTAEELRHTTFQRITHPEDLSAELEMAAQTLKGDIDHYQIEKRYLHKLGHTVWIHLTVSLVRDREGHPLYFIKQVQNITETRRASEKIAEQAALLDKTNDGIVLCGMDGCVQFWNKGAEAIYGWTSTEVDGMQVRELSFRNNVIQYEEACRATLKNGKWISETPVIHKDGHEFSVQSRWSLVKDQADKPKAFLVISHDITDRKAMESQLMRAQRMESIGTLAGGIAHDLNNILTPIMMSIEMLKQTSTHPRAITIIENIETITKRGADIVRQVLSFARGMKGDHVEVQPRHLLRDIQALIKETLPKNIQLKYCIPHEIWTIRGDPTQLHQIVMNLCVNARDAMPDGGSLTITTENAVIDEQYASMHLEAKPGKYVAISVADTGCGIPAAILDKIFEPFFTTKEIGKGTGLGLSTVIAIVKSHEGFLNVSTEIGKGTTFKAYLPAIEEFTSEVKNDVEIENLPRGNGETILIVDDEATILTVTSQTLETFGYKTLTAADGAEAVAVYAENRDKIAIVVTDMAMPVMDGKATIRVLRKLDPNVKIIAASGLKANSTTLIETNPEIKFFVDKPYTARTLLKVIRALLGEPARANLNPERVPFFPKNQNKSDLATNNLVEL